MKKILLWAVGVILVLTVIILAAFDTRLKTVEYKIESEKIEGDVKFALITDLHSCYYGENQKDLLDKLEKYNPDAVLLVGDIFDDVMPDENSKIFVTETAKKYKTYYVSGNHEWWSGRMYEMFEYISSCGVTVLRGDCDALDVQGQKINICGIDDADVNRYDTEVPPWEEQMKKSVEQADTDNFTMLLAHRPENAGEYFSCDFDLVLSGHAHGGQWRIPIFLNGVFAPNQGFFPEYAGGEYDFDGKKLIISRGLSRENNSIPRVFNRPEIVFVTLK